VCRRECQNDFNISTGTGPGIRDLPLTRHFSIIGGLRAPVCVGMVVKAPGTGTTVDRLTLVLGRTYVFRLPMLTKVERNNNWSPRCSATATTEGLLRRDTLVFYGEKGDRDGRRRPLQELG
jgi:hypothetical protein